MELSKEELAILIETAVEKAVGKCKCPFKPEEIQSLQGVAALKSEEVQTLKDVASGGIAFKRGIIYAVVIFVLVSIGVKVFK